MALHENKRSQPPSEEFDTICGFFDHLSKYCEKEGKCLSCGAPQHDSSKCSAEKSCINCKGNHATVDRSCPVYKYYAEIASVMTHNNLPYFEAKSLVIKEERKDLSTILPKKTLKNSPLQETPTKENKKDLRLVDTSAEHLSKGSNCKSLIKDCNEEIKSNVTSLMDPILDDLDILILKIHDAINLHNKVSDT